MLKDDEKIEGRR